MYDSEFKIYGVVYFPLVKYCEVLCYAGHPLPALGAAGAVSGQSSLRPPLHRGDVAAFPTVT
jgi:hypothetical protein